MSLRLVPSDEPPAPKARPEGARGGPATLPPSPDEPLPPELVELAEGGAPVLWWARQDEIDLRAVAGLGAILGLALLLVSLLAPELWSQPFARLWPPLSALASPLLLLLLREWAGRGAIAVTEDAVLFAPRLGAPDRLAFGNVRRIRRDLLRGGLILEGAVHRVRVPARLLDDTRQAIAAARAGRFDHLRPDLTDPLGWWP